MDEIKNIGYIYKITNKINGRCYIGQTSQNAKKRWKEHIKVYTNPKCYNYNYPLYKAFRKYGIKKFEFEVIEECEIQDLNKREIYWISYYNSYKEGYNQTLGGDGCIKYELNESEVVEIYNKEKNIKKVARKYNCSKTVIKKILYKHNVKMNNYNKHIYKLSTNNELEKEYDSFDITVKELHKQNPIIDISQIEKMLNNAILNNVILFEAYWTYANEITKKFRKNKSKEPKRSKNNIKNKCPICGKTIDKDSNLCRICYDKERQEKAAKAKEEKGINREFLKQEIRNKPFTTIAKEQGVSDNAIRKWCKKFNLPYKSTEIKKYSDEEWEKI